MSSYLTISEDVPVAVSFLKAGRVVAVPTGTSYGLASDTQQGWAIQRVRQLKGRPDEKPFSVFLAPQMWDTYLLLSARERNILTALDNQPVTVLVRPQPRLQHVARDGYVAVRIIDHPLMRALAIAAGVPLTATSANRSGLPPCYSPTDIVTAFSNPVPDEWLGESEPRGAHGTTYDLSLAMVLDGGTLIANSPSTIIHPTATKIEVVRPGALSRTQIESLLV